ncbi:MAG TPA: bifunctional diaminohydroxyphosphoribosylaminopyrimidine deaminase/5-amino-6-(5-phosphoribosylamino)uracil reductase RibD [Acidimicrobiia bacterium]|nr:bifunctional diaminohydroxyphosphoribosylaminopyrimidine deaminase/5-amino-6-(5-phosphoribosylamino)uracil reductase RibD [Acidimicrobiia bacterium]
MPRGALAAPFPRPGAPEGLASPRCAVDGAARRDSELMARAAELGEQGRRTAPPNPWVGAVVVDQNGHVRGEGFHERPGSPHAEALALAAAGARARGGTAYITLEPCAHQGRTPPCTESLITAGVRRVVVALEDPDPRVAGRGLEKLRAAGIDVVVGPGAAATTRSLAPYLHHRRTGRAWCVLKTAMSLDARTAAADGSSRWITGAAARADAHRLRAESQAVVVGAGTALADQPTLTARDVEPPVERQPLRVLLDSRGRVPPTGSLFDPALAPTLVVTTDAAPSTAVDGWRAAGAKVETVPQGGGGVDLEATLDLLGRHDVVQAMVEGGATLHGGLLAEGLADRIVAYVAPTVLGPRGLPAFPQPDRDTIADADAWQLVAASPFGDDVRLEYEPKDR